MSFTIRNLRPHSRVPFLSSRESGIATPCFTRRSPPVRASNSSIEDQKANMTTNERTRILCLHGYMQTASVFQMRTGSLRKALKSKADFSFIDAPFEVKVNGGNQTSGGTQEEMEDEKRVSPSPSGRTWWFWEDVGPAERPSQAVKYKGWDQTYQHLCNALKEHRPDGLLGFSQGATAVALLLSRLHLEQQRSESFDVPLPRFSIMVSAFIPKDPVFADMARQAQSPVPSLFVYGTQDTIIPVSRTLELVHCFPASSVSTFEHPGGHLVPSCSGKFKETLTAFIDTSMNRSGSQNMATSEEEVEINAC